MNAVSHDINKGTMNRICLLLAVALAASTFTGRMRAEETNSYPKSNLEIFEETTGIVIIRSVEDIGAAVGKSGGGVTVKCRQSRDPGTGRREFAVGLIVTQAQGAEDTTIVDFDELDALIRATEYIIKVDWSVTSLGHFEAGYITRSGFKVATYSSSRSGLIEAFVFSNRQAKCRASLTMDQLVRFHVLLVQTKAKIEILQREK